MKAQPGDWLVVHSHIEGRHDRRAEILATGPDGEPPFTVDVTTGVVRSVEITV